MLTLFVLYSHRTDQRTTCPRRTSVFSRLSSAMWMTTTRASCARRRCRPRNFVQSARPSCVRNVGHERRRPQLRNVRGDRCVVGMTHGTVTAASAGARNGAGSGMCPMMRAKVDRSRRRGAGMSTMTERESATMTPALREEAARQGAADTARAHLRTTRRTGRSDGGGGDDILRGRGAEVPMELTSGVLVAKATLRPSDIVHVPLMTGSIPRGSAIDDGGAPGVGVPAQTVLMMRIPARRTNDVRIVAIAHADAGTDHVHLPPDLTRRLAQRRCQTDWVLVLVLESRGRGRPVSLHQRRTAIPRDASRSCAENSKGREEHRPKAHPGARAHVRTPPHPHAIPPPKHGRALLLPVHVHRLVHRHPSLHQPTSPPTASGLTCHLKWTNTSNRRTTRV
jgi:hypothetical protein